MQKVHKRPQPLLARCMTNSTCTGDLPQILVVHCLLPKEPLMVAASTRNSAQRIKAVSIGCVWGFVGGGGGGLGGGWGVGGGV